MGCSVGAFHKNSQNFNPLENGFGYGQHSEKSSPAHSAVRTDLQYQDANGEEIVVWPHLLIIWGNNIVISNNLAVLVGGKAELYSDGEERLTKRLIAFEAPSGPPLDITDQVLQKYCAENGVASTNVMKDTFASLTKTNAAVQVDFGIIKIGERGPGTSNAHDATLIISWRDIEAIMKDVKKAGKLKKEKWAGTEYLQKE